MRYRRNLSWESLSASCLQCVAFGEQPRARQLRVDCVEKGGNHAVAEISVSRALCRNTRWNAFQAGYRGRTRQGDAWTAPPRVKIAAALQRPGKTSLINDIGLFQHNRSSAVAARPKADVPDRAPTGHILLDPALRAAPIERGRDDRTAQNRWLEDTQEIVSRSGAA